MKIAHISDLHFGRHFLPDVAERLRAQIDALDLDAIVVSGDLSQRARAKEFAQALAYLKRLASVPILVVPGNHDVPLYRFWERFNKPLLNFNRLSREFVSSISTDDVSIIGIDSTDPWRATINGRVSQAQLDQCAQAFAGTDSTKWRVVVMHHHLIPPPGYSRGRPMAKAERLLDALNNLGVHVVMSGHLHTAFVGNTLDIHRSDERHSGIVVVQCGTTTSRRGRGSEREKNSFNVVEFRAQELLVEHWVYFDISGTSDRTPAGFQRTSSHRFKRPG